MIAIDTLDITTIKNDFFLKRLKAFFSANFSTASFFGGIKFGLLSVVIPWFFFMPVLGKGFLGIKTPSPFMACSLAVGSHIAIGAPIGGFYQIFGY